MSEITQEAEKKSSKEPEVSENTTTLAILAHLGGIFFGFVPALIIMLVTKDEILKKHAKAALNWQISLIIYSVVFAIIAIVLFFVFGIIGVILGSSGSGGLGAIGAILFGLVYFFIWIFAMGLGIMSIVVEIIACVKTSQDIKTVWKYPLCLDLIK
jgi:uncharacterized Tic20 family protein